MISKQIDWSTAEIEVTDADGYKAISGFIVFAQDIDGNDLSENDLLELEDTEEFKELLQQKCVDDFMSQADFME